jgi:hypothetical protein
MQIHFRNLLLGSAVLLLASCSKPNTQGKLIPKEAAFVIQVDGKSLSSKLSWDEIKQNPVFAEASKDSTVPAGMKVILNNPDSAGIDTKTDLLFFALQDSIGGYVAFEGTIKNEDQFKNFIKTFAADGSENEADGIKFISKAPFCAGYTKDKFVYLFDAPQMSQMDALSRRMQRDSIDITPSKPRDIFSTCKALFALSESNSLAKNDKFTALLKENGDMHFWMNTEQLTKGAMNNPMMAMANLDKLYKGSLTTGTLNFENGKINIDVKSYVGDELGKLYKKYGDGKVSEDMLKRMPGKDIIGLMAIAYKPEGIKELLKLLGVDGIANMGLSNVGFTMDDFIKANKGDLVLGLSDLSMKKDSAAGEMGYVSEKPDFNFIFATSIGDKDAFNKLINAGKKLGEKGLPADSKAPFAYSDNGSYFAIANSKENADKFLSATNPNVDFINKINGQAFGGYLNIHLLLKAFEKEATKDSSASAVYDASLKLWDNLLFKGGDFKDGAIAQTVEVNLVDKTTNSLKQLNQYAAKLGEIYKARKAKEKTASMAMDATIPIEDVVAPPASKK